MLMFYLSMLDTVEEKLTFTEIYEQVKSTCLHVAIKITQDQAMAEDAVHNAFLAVIKHKDEIFNLPCGKRKSKIVIITKNKAIDLLRAEKKYVYASVDEIDDGKFTDDFDISSYIENQEAVENLISYITSLPEIYKSAFELRYVHEMNNIEIAELLNMTPKAVSTRISRAKVMLKELIEKDAKKNGK